MSAPDEPQTSTDTVDERGITLTAAGRKEARRKLDEADARYTPEQRAERRAKFLARINAAR
jgi:hypothetical protein